MKIRISPGLTVTRLALVFLLVQMLSFGLGLTIMYSFAQRTIVSDARLAAETTRDDLAAIYRHDGLEPIKKSISERLGSEEYRDFIIDIRDPKGARMGGNLREWPAAIGSKEPWRIIDLAREGQTQPMPTGVVTTPLGSGYRLLVGEAMDSEARLTRAIETAFLWAMLAGLALTSAVSFMIARVLGRRIDAFASVAGNVERGNLGARIPRSGAGDAFDRLGNSINAMLDRIEGLVRELRMLTDSMAHDLRSPISRMKATLERSLSQTKDLAALAALGQSIEEADGVHRLLSNALQISRAEAGMGRDQFADFDLLDLAGDVAEVYGPLAEDAGFAIAVRFDGPMPVHAHRDFLAQALTNLIENALKHAKGGTQINLVGAGQGPEITLAVEDDGPGIPLDQMGEALRRFGRLDPARTEAGAGLGLSLVETIAHLHGGRMIAEAQAPHGLRITLKMPIGRR